MPIIKQIAIHESPRRLVGYILDAKKNKDLKYATGICCHKEPEYAYLDLRDFYTLWSNKQFCNTAISGKKEDVLLIHYIQSFRPDECTPELAHKIGIQWVKRVFGSKRPVVISTHDNKSHIHNHFAVSVFDTEGKRWYLNKTTLRKCREESDKLAREYGLSVLDDAQYHPTQKYAEWLARKTGTSWKARIADQIDRLIYEDNVRSVDDLVEALREKGYTVNYKKYISVKPPNGKKSVRTFRLGDGYSIECLEYRIQHKNIEITDVDAEQYKGLARDYAVYLREMQLMIYRREQTYHKATYYDLVRTSELLCFISENHIDSEDSFKSFINSVDEKYRAAANRVKDLQEMIKFEEKLIADSEKFLLLWNKNNRTPKETQELGKYRVHIDLEMYENGQVDIHRKKLEKMKADLQVQEKEAEVLKNNRKKAADNYQRYLNMRPDYEKLMDRIKAEEERGKAEQEKKKNDRELEERYDRMREDRHSRKTTHDNVPR